MSEIKREYSIDALRGLAIIGMVLSGTIVYSDNVPSWMYHIQVGPPNFKFNPEIAGLSWVDLVFPFFLFTMGLSIPFALNGLLNREGISGIAILKKLTLRAFNLWIFAIMIPHLIPYGLPEEVGNFRWLYAILGFGAFMLTFTKFPTNSFISKYLNGIGYLSLMLLVTIRYMIFDESFSIYKNDIIILVLANMAIIGAGIWILTRKSWWTRIGVLALFLSIWLTSNIAGSFNAALYQFTPLKFLGNQFPAIHEGLLTFGIDTTSTIFYSMYFMKYLFIVIPGTIIGDIIYSTFHDKQLLITSKTKKATALLALILFSFTIVNLIGLYLRQTQLTLFITLGLMVIVKILSKKQIIILSNNARIWLRWSFFWLVLGLLLEPYEGGIKKDPATLSYFFVSSGLAGLLLFSLKLAFNNSKFKSAFNFLPMVGKNPMVGYVAVNFLIVPIVGLVGFMDIFEKWCHLNGFTNIFRGLLLTSLMILVTVLTVRFKLFWKT